MAADTPDVPAGVMASIGYEGRNLDEFLQVLVDNDIGVLVDVRMTPMSRKRGFSKRLLAEALAGRGIGYRHVPELGNPKELRSAFHTGAVESARRRYLAHINDGSREAYESVVELARTTRIALLCLEADERRCHRGCIVDQALDEHPDLAVLPL